MDQFTIMRRANGELFTLDIKGRQHLAVWPNANEALRYKAHNPELLVFVPAVAAGPFGQKSLAPLRRDNIELVLLSDIDGTHLRGGRKMSWQELDCGLSASSPSETAHRTALPPKPAPLSQPASVGVEPSVARSGGKV
jgi:hypothetical protein